MYRECRKKKYTSCEAAAEALHMNKDRLYRIETREVTIKPDEVNTMADGYGVPSLRDYYCAMDCPVGIAKKAVFRGDEEFSNVALQMLAALNDADALKRRLIDLAGDGAITEDEIEEFEALNSELKKISDATQAIEQWANQNIKPND